MDVEKQTARIKIADAKRKLLNPTTSSDVEAADSDEIYHSLTLFISQQRAA